MTTSRLAFERIGPGDRADLAEAIVADRAGMLFHLLAQPSGAEDARARIRTLSPRYRTHLFWLSVDGVRVAPALWGSRRGTRILALDCVPPGADLLGFPRALARQERGKGVMLHLRPGLEGPLRDAGFREARSRQWMEAPVVRRKARWEGESLRPSLGDLDAIGRLLCDAYRGTLDDEGKGLRGARAEAKKLLSGGYGRYAHRLSRAAIRGGRWLGACLLLETKAPREHLIGHIVVHPDARGQGLGRALLQGAMNDLARAGVEHVALWVTLGNDPALGLYRALGFAPRCVVQTWTRG